MIQVRSDYVFWVISTVLLGLALRSQTQVSVKQVNASYVVTAWAPCVDTPVNPPTKMSDCTGIILATILDVKKNESKSYTLVPAGIDITSSPLFKKEVAP